MTWWSSITSTLSIGLALSTPGRGIPPTYQGIFTIHTINPAEITIESGRGRINLERLCFDIVEQAFIANRAISLRVGAEDLGQT